MPLFPTTEITIIDKEKKPEHDINLGTPRTVEAHSIVVLPPGYRAELPDAVHVAREFTTYDKSYRLVDGKVFADRKLVVKVRKLPPDRWKDYVAFQKATLLEDGEPYLRLIPPDQLTIKVEDKKSASTNKPAPDKEPAPAAAESGESVRQQLVEITAMLQHRDLGGARQRLLALRKSSPDAPYVQGMLGLVKANDGDFDGGLADVKAEMKAHPDDNSWIVLSMAALYSGKQRYAEAETLLSSYGNSDDQVLRLRASLLNRQGDYAHALGILEEMQARKPDDRAIATEVANTFYSMHRNEEAAAAAKKAMEGSDDPAVINNNVYVLSETKLDLPFAETQSRRSVELLEKATAAHAIDEVNTKAFAESSSLSASWDTLGYILLLENKPKDAEPYLRAAWFDQANVIVGNHLGQAFEAEGRKADALWIYRLAMSAEHAVDSKEDYAQAKEAVARLEMAGVKPASGEGHPETMQAMRSFHVKNLSDAEGGGTARVQLRPDGIAEATLVSGDPKLKPLMDDAKTLKLPGAQPPNSEARILRDAVVYCGKKSTTCDFVFMTASGIGNEGAVQDH